MSGKFHVNNDGVAGPCGAEKAKCPFGGDSGLENHYGSLDEARQAFEKSQETFGSKENKAGEAMGKLQDSFQTFLASYVVGHKRTQGDDFEEFFAEHLKETGLKEFSMADLPANSTGEKVKASLKNLKDLKLTDTGFAKNELGEAFFIKHPNGEYNFPDYVVATPDHVIATEMKSGNNFSYIMLGAHTPKPTDVYVLADFKSKKELTMLVLGDHVDAEKLQAYDELRKDAAAIREKSRLIDGGLSVESGLTFRSQGPHPFRHPDKGAREARVIELFNGGSDNG